MFQWQPQNHRANHMQEEIHFEIEVEKGWRIDGIRHFYFQ